MDKTTRKQTILEMFEVLNKSLDDPSRNVFDGLLKARLDLRKYFDKKDNTSYHHEFYQRKQEI